MMNMPPSQLGKKFPNRKRPKPFSAEHRLNMSRANKGRKLSESHKKKLSEVRKGIKFSEEHRQNISKSLVGNERAKGSVHTLEVRLANSLRNIGKHVGEKNTKWKGDGVGYGGLHSWVVRKLGNPGECEACNTTDSKRFEWANLSGEYKRDLEDWARLCSECHHRFDDQSRKAWNTRQLRKVSEIL